MTQLIKDTFGFTEEQALQLEEIIINIADKRVEDAIDNLLHPVVKIVTPFDVPEYASESSAGVDIRADLFGIKEKFLDHANIVRKEDGTIDFLILHPGGQFLCPTGIHTSMDGAYEVEIRPRSGLALKKRITVTNSPGTIDADYKDEWGIILANEGNEDLLVYQGDRIAQAVFSLVVRPEFDKVDSVEDLSGSDRGGGFGHSGK